MNNSVTQHLSPLNFLIHFFLLQIFLAIPVVHASQYQDLLQEFKENPPDKFYTDHLISPEQNQTISTPGNSSKEIQDFAKQPPLPLVKEFMPQHFFTPDSTILQELEGKKDARTLSNLFTNGMTLDTFLTVVLLRNHKIQASQKRVEASRQSIRQAANLDAILKQYTAFSDALANRVGPMKGSKIQEKFPFPALASLKGRIARQNVVIAQEKQERTIRSVLTSCQKQFWNLLYNREAQKLTAEMIHLLEHLGTVARSRYETGKSGFQELIQVQITLETLKEKQINLIESQGSIEEKVRQLLDLPGLTNIGPLMVDKAHVFDALQLPKASLPALNQIAQSHRQELRIERATITRMELLIDLAESMIIPPFSLNFANFSNKAIQQVGTAPHMPPFQTGISAQNGAGLPKSPWFGTNDAFLEKTRHLLAARKAKLYDMESETKAIVREQWFFLDKAKRDVVLYRTKIVDLSESALNVVTQGYKTGKTPFAQVNLSYQNWLNSRLTLAKSISAVGIAMSQLSESLGVEDIQIL